LFLAFAFEEGRGESTSGTAGGVWQPKRVYRVRHRKVVEESQDFGTGWNEQSENKRKNVSEETAKARSSRQDHGAMS